MIWERTLKNQRVRHPEIQNLSKPGALTIGGQARLILNLIPKGAEKNDIIDERG